MTVGPPNRTAALPRVGTLTVVSGVQAFDGGAADAETGDGVPVAAKDLQPAERTDVQLRQPAVPHVQLDDVGQLLRLSHCHALQPVQPDRVFRVRTPS